MGWMWLGIIVLYATLAMLVGRKAYARVHIAPLYARVSKCRECVSLTASAAAGTRNLCYIDERFVRNNRSPDILLSALIAIFWPLPSLWYLLTYLSNLLGRLLFPKGIRSPERDKFDALVAERRRKDEEQALRRELRAAGLDDRELMPYVSDESPRNLTHPRYLYK